MTEVKVLARLHFYLELRVFSQAYMVVGRIQFRVVVGLRCCFHCVHQLGTALSSDITHVPCHTAPLSSKPKVENLPYI